MSRLDDETASAANHERLQVRTPEICFMGFFFELQKSNR